MKALQKEHPVWQLPGGQWLSVRSFTFGVEGGPSAYIQAGVHATEIQGCAVITALLEELAILPANEFNGRICLVPLANPYGLALKVGEHGPGPFDPGSGRNWNRCYPMSKVVRGFDRKLWETQYSDFWEAESVGAFKKLLLDEWQKGLDHAKEKGGHGPDYLNLVCGAMAVEADLVLDLHTTTRGIPFAYAPPFGLDSLRHLNVTDILVLDEVEAGALDEAISAPWIQLAGLFKRAPETLPAYIPRGITLELGDQEVISRAKALEVKDGIMAMLRQAGVLQGQIAAPERVQNHVPCINFRTLHSQQGGLVEFVCQPGESIQEGQVVAHVLNLSQQPYPRWSEIKSPYTGKILSQYPSAVVHRGAPLYRLYV